MSSSPHTNSIPTAEHIARVRKVFCKVLLPAEIHVGKTLSVAICSRESRDIYTSDWLLFGGDGA